MARAGADFPISFRDPLYAVIDASTEKRLGLPTGLLSAVRTRGERTDHGKVSSAGAVTPYQIIPATRKAALEKWGVDPTLSPENAAEVAGRLLKDSLDRNGGSVPLAVAEYHGGVNRAEWGPVTKSYVQRVTGEPLAKAIKPSTEPDPVSKPPAPGGSTFDRAMAASDPNAGKTSIAKVFDAYQTGKMTPEDAAAFEGEVKANRILLPRGAELKASANPPPASNAPADAKSAPLPVIRAFAEGKMTPEDAAAFRDLYAKGEITIPPELLSPAPPMPPSPQAAAAGAVPLPIIGNVGNAEALASLGSGALAFPVAGIAGLGTLAGNALGLTNRDPGDVVRSVQGALTYEPRTPQGQETAGQLAVPFEALANLGNAAGERTAEAAGSPALGAAANTAVQLLPQLLLAKGAGAARGAIADTVRSVPELNPATMALPELATNPVAAAMKAAPEAPPAVAAAAAPALSTADQAIERRLSDKLANHAAAVEEYATLPDAKGGKVLNVDTARELSPDYLSDRTKSAAVHEPASDFIKRVYAEKLAQIQPGDRVVFTAGGTGAGKSSAISALPEMKEVSDGAKIIYDTNMSSFESSRKKIDQALAADADVVIAMVQRDPVDALVRGALPRAMRQEGEFGSGRTVPIEEHAKTHRGAAEVIPQLAEHYADDPRVVFHVIDNTRGPGKAALGDMSLLRNTDYNGVEGKLNEALKAEYQAGRISESVYRGFAGADREASGVRPQAGRQPGAGPESGRSEEAQLGAQQLAATAKKASSGGLGASRARDVLAEQASPDAETVAAAKRLGIEEHLQPDHVTTNQAYRELAQAVKSFPGSEAHALERAGLEQVAARADRIVEDLGGSKDLSTVSSNVRANLEATQAKLDGQAEALYGEVGRKIPKTAAAPAPATLGFLRSHATDLGGAEKLAPVERKLLAGLAGEEGAPPTYAFLDRTRKEIGQAMSKASGPFKDSESGLLKKLYSTLSDDQAAVAKQHGAFYQYQAAKLATQMRKGIEDDLASLFGKHLDGSVVSDLTGGTLALQKGDTSRFVSLMASVPKELRPQVTASGLATVFQRNARDGALNFHSYANWYEGLQKNAQAYNALMANLPRDAAAQLRDLYQVAKGISKASRERIVTGRIQAVQAELQGADSLLANIYGVAQRSAKGVALEAVTSSIGLPGAGLSAGLASALTKGKPSVMKAADALISSPEFIAAARATGRAQKTAINKLAHSPRFNAFVRAAGRPAELERREQWILQAMQANTDGKK
jgi:hypothetical protein